MIYMDGGRPLAQVPGAGPITLGFAVIFTAGSVLFNVQKRNALREGHLPPEVEDVIERVERVAVEHLNPETFWALFTSPPLQCVLLDAPPVLRALSSAAPNALVVADPAQSDAVGSLTTTVPKAILATATILSSPVHSTCSALADAATNTTTLGANLLPQCSALPVTTPSPTTMPRLVLDAFVGDRTGTMPSPPPTVLTSTLMERVSLAASSALDALVLMADTTRTSLTNLCNSASRGWAVVTKTMDNSILFKPIGGHQMSTIFGAAAQTLCADAVVRVAGDQLTETVAHTEQANTFTRLILRVDDDTDVAQTARLVSRTVVEAGTTFVVALAGGGTFAALGGMHAAATQTFDGVKDQPLSKEYPAITVNRVIAGLSLVAGSSAYWATSQLLPQPVAAGLSVTVAKATAFGLGKLKSLFG